MPTIRAAEELPTSRMPLKSTQNNQASNHDSSALIPKSPEEKTGEEAAKQELLSPKYADIARQQKMVRRQMQELKNKEKALEEREKAKEAEYASKYVPKSQIAEAFAKDPLAAMKDYNLSGDQITQALLNQPSPQDRVIEELRQELAQLKGAQEQTKNLMSEQETRAYEQAVAQIQRDIARSIDANADQWQALKHYQAAPKVAEVIAEYYKETQELLTHEEAMQIVEEELLEQGYHSAKLPKNKARLLKDWGFEEAPTEEVLAPAMKKPKIRTEEELSPRTLTHSQTPSGHKPMSPRERAIAMLEGRLQ